MAYQDFPWQKGGSHSFKKLTSLSLPVLKNKRVLDVGCNEGYFCGWAHFQQASFVKGVDSNPGALEQARLWFPECKFVCMNWSDLGPEKYDLVLCLSAIHYADDQQRFIDMLMNRLDAGGLLVLELGIADGDADAFVPVARRVTAQFTDTRLFPTRAKVHGLLKNYAFKYMGASVMQAGDPTPRHVYHVQHKRPLAVLLMDGHYAGKSSLVNEIIRKDIFKIQGEVIYHAIADGTAAAAGTIRELIRFEPGTRHMIPPQITAEICKKGLLPELMSVFFALSGDRTFILEHYIPYAYRSAAAELCQAAGYFVADIALYSAHKQPWHLKRPPHKQYLAYRDYLKELCDMDEDAYLAANPDVAEAVEKRLIPSGRHHYFYFGKKEKRRLA